jgi:hypothetical protein
MKGASTRPTKKEAAARAAAADAAGSLSIPSEQEFRESLVIISVLKKLHPEGWDFAAARIIPKSIEKTPTGMFKREGYLEIPHLPLATSDAKVKEMHDSLSASRFDLRGVRSPPGTWQGSTAFGMAIENGLPTAAEMRAISIESFPQLQDYFPHYFDDTPDSGYDDEMDIAAVIRPAAEIFGLTEAELTEAAHQYKAAKAGTTARETTTRATAEPRLKWETDRQPDENPATFAWRAYDAEAKAGTLHRGVIYSEDRELHRRLNSWLRTYDMPEGIDIPTKPEWITRQIEAGRANPAPSPRTEGQRLYEAEKTRRWRSRQPSVVTS